MKYCKIKDIKGRMIQGYINAEALGWDSKNWRFSLKTNDKKLAHKRLKKLFNVIKSDTTLDYKFELQKIIYDGQIAKKKVKKPAVIKDSIENIMSEYLKNFEVPECLECIKTRKPFQMNYQKKYCHECKHFRAKKQWATQNSRTNKLSEYFKDIRIQDFDFELVKRYILEMKNNLSEDTIINYLDFLKSALNSDFEYQAFY